MRTAQLIGSAPVFQVDGAQRFDGAATRIATRLDAALAHVPDHHPGVRLAGIEALRPMLSATGDVGAVAAAILGPVCQAVRAIYFDKTPASNWSLGWHQDRTICVVRRLEVDGFGPWTTKGGKPHVSPPLDLLTRMVTLRVHLDDVPGDNAPLLIAPGSHRIGLVPVDQIATVVRRCGSYACLARAGDVWLYATPILHASEAAQQPSRRRVLQVDYAGEDLPGGLEWLGV